MNSDYKNLPMRSSSSGQQIDTRPMYVEEWLDALPYIDFKKTSQLLYEATRLTNEQKIKPAIRLELVELYGRPYHYYIDSQIKAGAQQTLQSIETARTQIKVLKKIAVNLSLACKLSAEEILKKKTLWKQTRPPLANLLLSLNFLSHALIFSFLEYAPTPKNVWREINFIYDFAESLSMENSSIALPDSHSKHGDISISQAYKRITLASLAAPHHLPYGAIWEIYEQLKSWANLVKISKYKKPSDSSCKFVINLDSDSCPIPFVKFNTGRAGDSHRLIDATGLTAEIQKQLKIFESGRKLDKSIIISPYFSGILLDHLSKVWGMPAKRKSPRKERQGTLELACGLNPTYFFLNNENEFIPPVMEQSDDDNSDEYEENIPSDVKPNEKYIIDKWTLVDQSSRGFAVIKNNKPGYNVRVGDLIIINTKNQQRKWAIGVIRWLMIRKGETYKLGVQILSTKTETGAIRACSGSSQDTRFRRALLISQKKNKEVSVITSKGIYMKNRDIEIVRDGTKTITKTTKLLESTTGFEEILLSDPV